MAEYNYANLHRIVSIKLGKPSTRHVTAGGRVIWQWQRQPFGYVYEWWNKYGDRRNGDQSHFQSHFFIYGFSLNWHPEKDDIHNAPGLSLEFHIDSEYGADRNNPPILRLKLFDTNVPHQAGPINDFERQTWPLYIADIGYDYHLPTTISTFEIGKLNDNFEAVVELIGGRMKVNKVINPLPPIKPIITTVFSDPDKIEWLEYKEE